MSIPPKCDLYVDLSLRVRDRLWLEVILRSSVALAVTVSFLLFFLAWEGQKQNQTLIRELAEATPEEREQRLNRMCQQNNIEIRRREIVGTEKGDDFWVTEKGNLL